MGPGPTPGRAFALGLPRSHPADRWPGRRRPGGRIGREKCRCPGLACRYGRRTRTGSRPAQELRERRGGARRGRRRGARRDLRLPGPERRGQVVHDADDRVRVAPVGRVAAGAGDGPGRRRSADPGSHRRRPAARQPRHRADGPGEPGGLRAVLRSVPGARAGEGRRADGVRPARRPGGRGRRVAVGRHETAAHDRPLAGERPRAAAARRADHRARPAGPPPALGPAVPAQGRGGHADRHHALHGRGRAAVRPAGGDGRRGDRRRGLTGRAHHPVLHARGAGAAVPGGRHRPGRGGGAARPSAWRSCRTGCCSTPRTASTCRPSWPAAGVRPLSALVRRSSLEDVFLRLTGRSLVD